MQYLILAHARQYPQLLQNYGNIALLSMAADAALISETLAESSRTAYRHYRKQQHNTKLRDAVHAEADSELRAHYHTVKALWLAVFDAEAAGGA